MPLNRQPNIDQPDDFYQELIDSQRDLDEQQAASMSSKLVLILANHVGDREVIREAIALARPRPGPGPITAGRLPQDGF